MSRTGLVVSAHGRHVMLETPDGLRLRAHPRGKRSDLVVGDRVAWEPVQAGADQEGVITATLPRRNLMHRQDLWKTKSFAANLDQVLMLVAGQPLFSESQLSRALVAAEAADIPVVVVHNKIDLPQAELARQRLQPYVRMGIEVVEVSVLTAAEEAMAVLRGLMDGRTSLLLGASGTGKSSIVNRLLPEADIRVGELSQALQAGKHTTTHTSWYWLDGQRRSAIIDSPGFQEFGVHQVPAAQLAAHMADFRPHLPACRFSNCQHRQEPDCGVLAAVARGDISPSRHRIYLDMLDELQQTRW